MTNEQIMRLVKHHIKHQNKRKFKIGANEYQLINWMYCDTNGHTCDLISITNNTILGFDLPLWSMSTLPTRIKFDR